MGVDGKGSAAGALLTIADDGTARIEHLVRLQLTGLGAAAAG